MIRFNDILEKVSFYKDKDINLLKKAYVFAAQAHKGQIRRSGEPYLSHPLEVTSMLADMKLDKTTLAAGLLHDVLEDTDVTAIELEQNFGKEIFQLVEGVTKISRVQESSPETRQAESIRKIIIAMTDDFRVIFIKLADRVHNLKTLKFLPESKQKKIARETLDIYVPIANRLGMGRLKAELEDLSFLYVDPENYLKIVSLVEAKRKKAEKDLDKLSKTLKQLMKENHVPAEIHYRIKRPYSIYTKMINQNIEFDQVYDLMALRIVSDTEKNCYSALGIVHQKWPHLPHRVRDFIAMPKPNLYQSLQTTIITKEKQTVEIQFRTHKMHDLAENGIAAHWKYKEASPQSLIKADERLRWLRETVELYKEQKNPQEFLKTLKTDLIPEETYVFTPKGKVITLPLGSSVLDFAFKIHTEIGLHATGAKINGVLVPLKTIVKTEDIAEILTSPEKEPRREWLNMVFTHAARSHIKRRLNIQDKKKNISFGKNLWEKELKKYNIASSLLKENAVLKSISKNFNYRIKKIEDFYNFIGAGRIVLDRKFIEKLFPHEKLAEKKETLLKKVASKISKRPSTTIRVKDTDNLQVNLAKCCSPIKGEPIIGYITSGKGIKIHSLRCPLVKKEILDSRRMIEASWSDSIHKNFSGKLLIKGEDSPGVLANITAAIAQLEGNIKKAEVLTFSNKKAQIKLTLKIRDIKQLEDIIKKISSLKEISLVERI